MSTYKKLKDEWEAELAQSRSRLARMSKAQSHYFDLGVSLLELCSNCTLKDGTVQLSLREPFKSMLEIRQEAGDTAKLEDGCPYWMLFELLTFDSLSNPQIANG